MRVSMPKEPRPKWLKYDDQQRVDYFREQLAVRNGLTISEWDAYDRAWKRLDPKGYAEDKAAASKRIDIKRAKESLTIEELQQIIADKIAESQQKAGTDE